MSDLETKADVVAAIAACLHVAPPRMSTGSTEPKEIFQIVNEQLGLGLDPKLTKPDLARAIVEAAGFNWAPTHESRGGTVTISGLRAVLRAVELFTG
ncbi:MAG TPA: hypothetical protein VGX28_13890 [Frankiaceae bacterium]|jgi:hypothetical protein|nr:hypothetical protein [Frankiaceae bacterium]